MSVRPGHLSLLVGLYLAGCSHLPLSSITGDAASEGPAEPPSAQAAAPASDAAADTTGPDAARAAAEPEADTAEPADQQVEPPRAAEAPAPPEPPADPSRTDTAEPADAPEPVSPLPWLATALDEPPDLWARIRDGFALAPSDHARVQASLRWYRSHPEYLDRVSDRARPFLHHIVEAVEARDMPTELALLPVVESAFRPFAYSHGRAAGIWQFIPGTGRLYGLKQNWWYDGRRDVVASTDAALDYLERLHERFDGNWLHALAAYNAGGATVQRAIERNQRAGRPTDFWHLHLPHETRGYVPKLLALQALVADPAAHGVDLEPIADAPRIAVVELDGQIDLAVAAELAGIDLARLYRLNPGFNRWATAPQGPHRLVVPVDQAETFKTELAQLPDDERVQWARHEIRSGETLSQIARRYHTTVSMLRRVNRIRGHMIRAGDHLLIPRASRSQSAYSLSAPERRKAVQHRQREGQKRVHVVHRGESLWEISRRYGVTVRELASWNDMAPGDVLRPGQRLVVWVSPLKGAWIQPQRPGPPAEALTQRVRYAVRPGDSLFRIAQRFRVSVADLRRWNSVGGMLQPGQRLTVYVDVRRQH